MKKFTTEIVKSFKVSKDLVRVGLAQFSNFFQQEFVLKDYYNEELVTKHILAMNQRGGGTNIGLALDSIRDYFEASQGSRRSAGVSQNLVLITDGESQDDVEDAADKLRALGIEVFAIGIGDVHDLELLQITGTPERLFTVQNFGSLENIKQKVIDTICESKPPKEQSGELKTVTLPLYLSPYISHLSSSMSMTAKVKDISLFTAGCTIDIAMGFDITRRTGNILISGQDKLQTFLPEIAHYISSVPGLCCVGPEPVKTNLAYRVVSRDGRSLDDFKFEGYSEEVLRKVMTTNLAEPTYFNTALLRSFGEKFKAESRAGVKVSQRRSTKSYMKNNTPSFYCVDTRVKTWLFCTHIHLS